MTVVLDRLSEAQPIEPSYRGAPPRHWVLECPACGVQHAEFTLSCVNQCHALLGTRYRESRFRPGDEAGLFRFREWLPCAASAFTAAAPVVHRLTKLGAALGLDRLYSTFCGFWPEIGAFNPTGTFKDLEAAPTLVAYRESGVRHLILASAGNTARAFAQAADPCSMKVTIVVPEGMLHRLWLPAGQSSNGVRLLAVRGSADYYDAIRLADRLAKLGAGTPEGGARNVARRDGMGTVMLEAARVLGELPRHYVQAVGSGTGAIAAWEAAVRLRQDPAFADQPLPRLHVAQNAPFHPIVHAWTTGEPIVPAAWTLADGEVYATVLTNRNPPYSVRGGMADALEATGGAAVSVSSKAARAAHSWFAELEGIDLEPAAAVAVAALADSARSGAIATGELVLLNLTGGGIERLYRQPGVRGLVPDFLIDEHNLERVAGSL